MDTIDRDILYSILDKDPKRASAYWFISMNVTDEPDTRRSSVETYGDALWLCFQTVTTIGFGDLPTTGALCRVSLVFLSVVSIFYLAVITGVVVAYCNQLIERQGHESMARITDELEHLDELSPQQLRELSARIKRHQAGKD